jgi:hypothetical protein
MRQVCSLLCDECDAGYHMKCLVPRLYYAYRVPGGGLGVCVQFAVAAAPVGERPQSYYDRPALLPPAWARGPMALALRLVHDGLFEAALAK